MPGALVTGASGFVGQVLTQRLVAEGWNVRAAFRADPPPDLAPGVEPFRAGELGPDSDWRTALHGVNAVFHLAARVHQLRDTSPDPAAEYRRINLEGTRTLARAAATAGVARLVFVSSIKVNGEARDRPYHEEDVPSPADPYGVTKWEAEQALARLQAETGLETVVVRPPLVYGPGVKANMFRLIRAVDRGLPLPFGSLANRRSLVYVENLADALIACGLAPRAAGRTYLVSDGEDLSTPGLVRAIAAALGRPLRLVPVPVSLLRFAAGALGASDAADRLAGSLSVDSTRIRRELGWSPPFSTTAGLERTADWYLSLSGRASSRRIDR